MNNDRHSAIICIYISFITAYSEKSLLANTSLELLSLHTHTGETLPNSTLLNEIVSGRTGNDPLIIRSALQVSVAQQQPAGTISPDQFLALQPPAIQFRMNPNGISIKKSSGARKHPKHPKNVKGWDTFMTAASNYSVGDGSGRQLRRPKFIEDYSAASNEFRLYAILEINVMNAFNVFLNQMDIDMTFDSKAVITTPMKGIPDFVLHTNGELKSVGEIKTIYDLHTPGDNETLVQWWLDDAADETETTVRQTQRPSVCHIIRQIYGYISNHGLKYGILTNGQVFWFLHRPHMDGEFGTLYVSPPVPIVGTAPTLFQAIMYFVTLVQQEHHVGQSPDSVKPDVPETQVEESAANTVSHSYSTRSQRRIFLPGEIPAELELSELQICIGEGLTGSGSMGLRGRNACGEIVRQNQQ